MKKTHWVSLFINKNITVYFDSFGIEYIPQEVLNEIRDKSITHNMVRIQDDKSIMCRFYWIAFIEYMLARKYIFENIFQENIFLDYDYLFSPNDYKKNDKII